MHLQVEFVYTEKKLLDYCGAHKYDDMNTCWTTFHFLYSLSYSEIDLLGSHEFSCTHGELSESIL